LRPGPADGAVAESVPLPERGVCGVLDCSDLRAQPVMSKSRMTVRFLRELSSTSAICGRLRHDGAPAAYVAEACGRVAVEGVISVSMVRVQSFAVSIDGYGAGSDQDLQNPLGVRGPELMEWFFETRVWRTMHGMDGGESGIDNGIAERGLGGLGAWILGRNMFGPIRGPWLDDAWKGWWGDEPPYHVPVFVLTHHPRPPVRMAGGTEFRFITEGIHAALEQARAAAGDRDVRIGGGVATIRQYLLAGLIDELHLAIRPVLLGSGEHLLRDLDLRALGYECAEWVAGERAMHVYLRKRA
jgi:dihydrofolate reductase